MSALPKLDTQTGEKGMIMRRRVLLRGGMLRLPGWRTLLASLTSPLTPPLLTLPKSSKSHRLLLLPLSLLLIVLACLPFSAHARVLYPVPWGLSGTTGAPSASYFKDVSPQTGPLTENASPVQGAFYPGGVVAFMSFAALRDAHEAEAPGQLGGGSPAGTLFDAAGSLLIPDTLTAPSPRCRDGPCHAALRELAAPIREPAPLFLLGTGLLILALGRVAGGATPWRRIAFGRMTVKGTVVWT